MYISASIPGWVLNANAVVVVTVYGKGQVVCAWGDRQCRVGQAGCRVGQAGCRVGQAEWDRQGAEWDTQAGCRVGQAGCRVGHRQGAEWDRQGAEWDTQAGCRVGQAGCRVGHTGRVQSGMCRMGQAGGQSRTGSEQSRQYAEQDGSMQSETCSVQRDWQSSVNITFVGKGGY